MGILNDTDITNITIEEAQAMRTLLKSDRCGILLRQMCDMVVDMDNEGASFLVALIPGIVRRQTDKAAVRIGNMQNFMYMLGRSLSCDTVSSGSRKGKPAFLTAKFTEDMDRTAWYALAFVYDYANFQDSARKVDADPGRFRQVTASSVAENDELTRIHVNRFRKFLDDLETNDVRDLVSPMIFDTYPGMMEFVEWCRENRKVWDDMEDDNG